MKNKKLLLLLPLGALLIGCSDSKKTVDLNLRYVTTNSVPSQSTDPNAQAQIAEAATAVGDSLQQLSEIQTAVHPQAPIQKPLNPRAVGMAQVTSLNWSGPLKPLLRKIAQASNYRLRIIGRAPAVPIMVYLNVRNQPLANILRNVTYQVTEFATIVVYPGTRVIELRYHN